MAEKLCSYLRGAIVIRIPTKYQYFIRNLAEKWRQSIIDSGDDDEFNDYPIITDVSDALDEAIGNKAEGIRLRGKSLAFFYQLVRNFVKDNPTSLTNEDYEELKAISATDPQHSVIGAPGFPDRE